MHSHGISMGKGSEIHPGTKCFSIGIMGKFKNRRAIRVELKLSAIQICETLYCVHAMPRCILCHLLAAQHIATCRECLACL